MRTHRGYLLGVCSSKGFRPHAACIQQRLRGWCECGMPYSGERKFPACGMGWLAWRPRSRVYYITVQENRLGFLWMDSVRNRDKEKGTWQTPVDLALIIQAICCRGSGLPSPVGWSSIAAEIEGQGLSCHTAWPPYIHILRSPLCMIIAVVQLLCVSDS